MDKDFHRSTGHFTGYHQQTSGNFKLCVAHEMRLLLLFQVFSDNLLEMHVHFDNLLEMHVHFEWPVILPIFFPLFLIKTIKGSLTKSMSCIGQELEIVHVCVHVCVLCSFCIG